MRFQSKFPNIEAERAKRNMAYEDLAKKMGVSHKTVYSWLSSGNIPQQKLDQMAQMFHCSTDYLLGSSLDGAAVRNTPGQLIKAARIKAGLTQKELGEKLGLAYQTVAQWENDLRKPKIETLARIAEAIGEDPYSLSEDVAPTIGGNIRKARIEKGLTQKEVAEKCGMADSAIRKYESGKVCPKIETLKRIAEALGEDFYSLADIEEEPHPAGDPLRRITDACEKLTDTGREKVAEFIELVAGNPKYRRQEEDYLNGFEEAERHYMELVSWCRDYIEILEKKLEHSEKFNK